MTTWPDLRGALGRVIMILAMSAMGVGPASDAHAHAPVEDDTPSTGEMQQPRAILVAEAKLELERAMRVLTSFGREQTSEFHRYAESLEITVGRVTTSSLQSAEVVAALLGSLRDARQTFERDLTSVRDWRRLALAIDPDVTVLRIPRRFVRRSTREPALLEPWSPEERRVWMGAQAQEI